MSRRLALIMAALLTGSALFAGEKGEEAAPFLTMPADAKGAAMGEAYSAAATGADGIWYNPAGMSRSDSPSITVMHSLYLEDITYSALGFAFPLLNNDAIGVGASMLRAGTIEGRDNTGATTPSYSPRDLSLRVGYARSFGGTSLGASLFYLRSTIADTAATGGLNLGVQQILGPVSLAIGLENFGGKLKYEKVAEPLPQRLRFGTVFHFVRNVAMSLDVFKPKTGSTRFSAGTEYHRDLNDTIGLSVRGGYNGRSSDGISGLTGITAGAGVSIGDVELDYAWIPFGNLGDTHRVSMSIHLGDSGSNPNSESALRDRAPLKSNKAGAPVVVMKAPKAKDLYPLYPWNMKKGIRNVKDRVMDILAQDALCATTSPRAIVTRTRGVVGLKMDDEQRLWSRVRQGRFVFEGDRLRTYNGGIAHVVFSNGVRAEVGSNSLLSVEMVAGSCNKSVTNLTQGDIRVLSEGGKEVEVKTPLGNAFVVNAHAKVSYTGKAVAFRVYQGTGSFVTDGSTITVQAKKMYTKSTDPEDRPGISSDDEEIETLGQITEAQQRTTPGRWDPKYAGQFSQEIMRLDSIPDLTLAEYIRDNAIRKEFQLSVYDGLSKLNDKRNQLSDFRLDIENFTALRLDLKKRVEGETGADRKSRKAAMKQAAKALSNAQRSVKDLSKELVVMARDVRENENFLAAIPIVRYLNITANEQAIPFEKGRAVIPDNSHAVLDQIADAMVKMKPYRIMIEGHTDKSGSAFINRRLSKQRAEAVAQYLRRKSGVPARAFRTRGMGSSKPLSAPETPEIDAKNRRVEVWFELRGL